MAEASGAFLRRATLADLASIAAIERACFGNPWTEQAYGEELQREYSLVEVAEVKGEVVGLSCTWFVEDEAHLLRIATLPPLQGRGIARDLLRSAVVRAHDAGCAQLGLEVARHNEPAIALYRRAGFQVVGLRKAYYEAPPDDALVMVLPLPARGQL